MHVTLRLTAASVSGNPYNDTGITYTATELDSSECSFDN